MYLLYQFPHIISTILLILLKNTDVTYSLKSSFTRCSQTSVVVVTNDTDLLFTMRVFGKDLLNNEHAVVGCTIVDKHIFYVIIRLCEECLRTLSDIFLYAIYWHQYRNLHLLLDRYMLKLTVQKRHQS